MKQIVSVGIDVSKGKSTVCAMIHPNTIIKESFEVLHTVEEMSMLADYIGSLDGEIRIVMESTGHYHLPVAQFLYQKGFFVCVENAYIIRQFSRIMLHGAKTDPLDAKKLAKYGLAYWSELKPYKFHPSCYTELRRVYQALRAAAGLHRLAHDGYRDYRRHQHRAYQRRLHRGAPDVHRIYGRGGDSRLLYHLRDDIAGYI